MALVLKDRVKVTTTTTGTGAFAIGGAQSGFQGFSAFANGDTTYYTVVDHATGAWETGVGTYNSTGPTLARTAVLDSSNAGGLVNFGIGPKDLFVVYPAGKAVSTEGNVTLTGPLAVPAGATGAEVPRRSEVVGIAGTETITGAKTFSVSPIVPAGQTGNGPARANEVARLAAANTFAARQVIADPANQGGMATAAQGLGGLEIRANGAGMAAIALHRVGAFFAYLGLDTDSSLAIGGGSFGAARRRIYHEGNILGTVAAVGGAPTGAILERGANANGQYIRYADGTQICWHALSTDVGGTNWVYPIGFTASPVTVANEQDIGVTRFYMANPFAGFAALRAFEVTAGAFSAGNARAIAIGRWF